MKVPDHRLLMARRQLMMLEARRVDAARSKAQQSVLESEQKLQDLRSKRDSLLRSLFMKESARNSRQLEAPFALNDSRPHGWVRPDLRVANAWKMWIQEESSANDFSDRSEAGERRIAFLMSGGLGDLLQASVLFPDLCRHFGGLIHVFYNNSAAREILQDNPCIGSVTILKCEPHDFLQQCLRHLPLFDLAVYWRYSVKYVLPPCSRLDNEHTNAIIERSDRAREDFERYTFHNQLWPLFNNGFSRDLEAKEYSILDVSRLTSGLAQAGAPISFVPQRSSMNIVAPHRQRPYVTVHHGHDPNALPDRTIKTNYGSTKNISKGLWGEIIAGVRDLGFDVVQLGSLGEEVLPGVSAAYLGQTSFSETAMLIKGAVCHLDTEGGLVHIARAVHTRCVVMFGPTPVHAFGYKQNVNIQAHSCNACWFTTHNWMVQCPRMTPGPECMAAHRAEPVLEAVRTVYEVQQRSTVAIQALDKAFPSVADILAYEGRNQGRVLVLVDAHLRGTDAWFFPNDDKIECSSILDDSPPYVHRLAENTFDSASLFNLPHEDDTFDLVICVTDLWTSADAGHILREVSRVAKRDGVVVGQAACRHSPDERPLIRLDALLEASCLGWSTKAVKTASCPAFRLQKQIRPGPPVNMVGAPPELREQAHGGDTLQRRLENEIFALNQSIHHTLALTHALYSRLHDMEADLWSLRSDVAALRGFPDGWIETSFRLLDDSINNYLLEGWHPPDDWQIWGAGSHHSLQLALPAKAGPHTGMEVELCCNLIAVPGRADGTVRVYAGNTLVKEFLANGTLRVERISIAPPLLVAGHAVLLTFEVTPPVTPSAAHADLLDVRSLGLGLARLRFRSVQALDVT